MGLYLVILILLCGDFEFPANLLFIHRINLIIIGRSFNGSQQIPYS